MVNCILTVAIVIFMSVAANTKACGSSTCLYIHSMSTSTTPTVAPTATPTVAFTPTATPSSTPFNFVVLGDSKTVGERCCSSQNGYRNEFITLTGGTFVGSDALSGWYAANLQSNIDAWVLTIGTIPNVALINIGTNDLFGHTTEVDYKSRVSYIVDAIHVAWPSCQVRLALPWRRTQDADSDAMAGWIDSIILTRNTWLARGYDERIALKGSDDGVTFTEDGEHANSIGYTATAQAWCHLINPTVCP